MNRSIRTLRSRRRPLLLAALAVAAMAAAPASGQSYPDNWYFHGRNRPAALRAMEGKPAPALKLESWIGEPQDLEALRGQVVVVDFWATWCGPCMRALPKNVKMMDAHRDDGLMIIGVHDARRGSQRMPAVAQQMKLNYPLAVDDGGASARAWNVSFWPTYVVIDRAGVVRAAGLTPDAVERVVEQVLAEGGEAPAADSAPAPRASGGIPAEWLEGSPARRERLAELADSTPPAIVATEWLNSRPLSLEELKGRVVLLDFWATWCGPCIRSIPKMNELQEKYGGDGLSIIGVCHPQKVERMSEVATKHGIRYPLCADASGEINRRYEVNGYPDYFLIDRSGQLRIADCRNDRVEEAVKLLLDEEG